LHIEHGQLHPALQIRAASAPHSRAANTEHFHDLRFGNTAIQAGKYMCTIDLACLMYSFATNGLDSQAIFLAQV